MVSLKGQLGLGKGRVSDSMKEIPDMSTRVIAVYSDFFFRANINWYTCLWHSTLESMS